MCCTVHMTGNQLTFEYLKGFMSTVKEDTVQFGTNHTYLTGGYE